MKKTILSLCLAMTTWIVTAQGIQFEKGTFAEALEKARQENKVVFVDVYAVWCGPCKWMSNTVFPDPEIGKYTDEHFVAIKIDCERGEGPSIQTRYAVEGLPGYLFLDPEGNVVLRGAGSMPAEKFMAMLKQAREYAADPNSVGRMAARYEAEKNDESFLRTYLDRLKSSGSAAYYDVVEQYLRIQKSMAANSGEMVRFLYDHANCLVFGGEADRILKENLGSETWDQYVRKEVRETFQKLTQTMARQTTEYAVLKRDTAWIGIALRRAAEEGIPMPEGQKERLMMYFYCQTEQGEAYKKLATPQIETFCRSLNVEQLKAGHERIREQIKSQPDRVIRSHAMINSEKLRSQLAEFARFATQEDGPNMLKWSKKMYDILPDDVKNAGFYAKVLYLYGDRSEGIRLMEDVCQAAQDTKATEGFRTDLELMKAGGKVLLTY